MLSSSPLVMVQAILASTPCLPHIFEGFVTFGGDRAAGVEIVVKAYDQEQDQLVVLDFEPGWLTSSSTQGAFTFGVRADDGDPVTVFSGGIDGQGLLFYIEANPRATDGLVQAATSVTPGLLCDDPGPAVGDLCFKSGERTRVDLSIFGAPTEITVTPSVVAEGQNYTVALPTFTWVDPPGDVRSYEVRILLEEADFADNGLVSRFAPQDGLSQGPHTFEVRAVGESGRKGVIGFLEFFVDTLAPSIPANVERVRAINVTEKFTWERSTYPGFPETGSGVNLYEWEIKRDSDGESVDSGQLLDTACVELCEQAPNVTLTPGGYIFNVLAVDKAANRSASATKEFFEGEPIQIQNLRAVDAIAIDGIDTFNIRTPRFQ